MLEAIAKESRKEDSSMAMNFQLQVVYLAPYLERNQDVVVSMV